MFLSKVEGDMRRLIQRWKGGREWRGGRQHHFPAKYQTRTPRPSSSDLSVMSKASARCNNNIGLLLAWKNIWWTTVLDHNDPSYFMERYVSHSPIRIHWTSWNFLSWKKTTKQEWLFSSIFALLCFQGLSWEIWKVCLNYSNWHFIARHPWIRSPDSLNFERPYSKGWNSFEAHFDLCQKNQVCLFSLNLSYGENKNG